MNQFKFDECRKINDMVRNFLYSGSTDTDYLIRYLMVIAERLIPASIPSVYEADNYKDIMFSANSSLIDDIKSEKESINEFMTHIKCIIKIYKTTSNKFSFLLVHDSTANVLIDVVYQDSKPVNIFFHFTENEIYLNNIISIKQLIRCLNIKFNEEESFKNQITTATMAAHATLFVEDSVLKIIKGENEDEDTE